MAIIGIGVPELIILLFIAAPIALVVFLVKQATKGADTVQCPYCAEVIRAEAVKCKHCGSDLATEASRKDV